MKDAVKTVSKYEGIRNHTIVLTKNFTSADEKRVFAINSEYLKKAIQELLINAFKFSDEGTKVFILYEFSKDKMIVSFLNTPDPNGKEKMGFSPNIIAFYLNLSFDFPGMYTKIFRHLILVWDFAL